MSPAAFLPVPAELLVPLLRTEGGAPDPVAIATWYLALGSAGGVVLVGPQALAADRIGVPLPNPQLLQDDLFSLEQILRRAKYSSALAVPVRHDGRDVGVMLFGSFGP